MSGVRHGDNIAANEVASLVEEDSLHRSWGWLGLQPLWDHSLPSSRGNTWAGCPSSGCAGGTEVTMDTEKNPSKEKSEISERAVEFSCQASVGDSAWRSGVPRSVVIIKTLTESSGLGMFCCCRDLQAALWGCHLESPASEDSLQTGGAVGSMQKTHRRHFNTICSKLVAKNGASGRFSLCNNSRHSYLLNIYLCVSDAIQGVLQCVLWCNSSGQCKLIQ